MDPRSALRAVSARAMPRASYSALPRRDVGGVPGLGVRDASLATDAGLGLYLARQFLPWRRDGDGILIAAADLSAANLSWLRGTFGGAQIVSIGSIELHKEIARQFRERLSNEAVFSLASKMPEFSARRTIMPRQAAAFAAVGIAAAVACCLWPFAVAQILVAAMSAGFVVSATFRAALAVIGRRNNEACAPLSGECALPIYTILVPLYREAKIVPQLAQALLALDYPRDRLDIKLVVEEDDGETCGAAEALTAQGPFEVLHVPACLPRTKPKACNYAVLWRKRHKKILGSPPRFRGWKRSQTSTRWQR